MGSIWGATRRAGAAVPEEGPAANLSFHCSTHFYAVATLKTASTAIRLIRIGVVGPVRARLACLKSWVV